MADKRGLGLLGLVFVAMTAGVTLASVLIVGAHVEGRVDLEGYALQADPAERSEHAWRPLKSPQPPTAGE